MTTYSPADLADLAAVRIKLGPDRAAPQPDALGRSRVGYLVGVEASDLWERGRGVWKAKLPSVAAADLALLVYEGLVVGVGTIDGTTFHTDRVAIVGQPDPTHPLIGEPDPLANTSRNPIAYGVVRTWRPVADQVDPSWGDVLADASRILSEAVRLRRPTIRPTSAGGWEPDPTRTERADWAEFVTLALAAAAANAGGIETALSGRPGSWEADGVRSLLESAVGSDEVDLWTHRTEPVRITLNLNELLADRTDAYSQYDEAQSEVDRRYQAAEAAEPELDVDRYVWLYDVRDEGDPVPHSPEVPSWSWDAWRAGVQATGRDPRYIASIERHLRDHDGFFTAMYIPKNAEAGAELDRLEEAREARLSIFGDLEEGLEQQRLREWAAYGDALTARIHTIAASIPGLRVPIEIHVNTDDRLDYTPAVLDELTQRLIDTAIADTPSPADLPGTPLERLQQTA